MRVHLELLCRTGAVLVALSACSDALPPQRLDVAGNWRAFIPVSGRVVRLQLIQEGATLKGEGIDSVRTEAGLRVRTFFVQGTAVCSARRPVRLDLFYRDDGEKT
jgi:hypothetical protein